MNKQKCLILIVLLLVFSFAIATHAEPIQTGTPAASANPASAGSSTVLQPGQQLVKTDKFVIGCNNQQRCKEIDQVWNQVLGLKVTDNNLVWDHQNNSFKKFDDVYYEFKVVTANAPGSAMPSGSYPGSSQVTPAFSSKEWQDYQTQVGSTLQNPGKAGGETFTGFAIKSVNVNFKGSSWTLNLNPGQSCPSDICLNDITPKAKKVSTKTGLMIHSTVGHNYLGLTQGWNKDYWDPNEFLKCHQDSVAQWNQKYSASCGTWPVSKWDGENEDQIISDPKQTEMAECAKKIDPKEENSGYRKSISSCRALNGHTHYIFDRSGDYAQHASEYAAIWHSATGAGDTNIPESQWDMNTISIEVANAEYSCEGICHGNTGSYKGKTAKDCDQSACATPNSLWGPQSNYPIQSDFKVWGTGKWNINYEIYSDQQMKGLIKFVSEIIIRHNIPIDNLIRHIDNTKRGSGSTHGDPGPMFDWKSFKKSVCQAVSQYKQQSMNCDNLEVCAGCQN